MAETTKIPMPGLGESVVEGTLVRWLVQPGAHVKKDQPLAEVSTDKADADLPSPVAGTIKSLLAHEGDVVQVGRPLAEIEQEQAAEQAAKPAPLRTAAPAQDRPEGSIARTVEEVAEAGKRSSDKGEPTPRSSARPPRASPLVRKLARTHAIDLDSIQGSGTGGRVTRDDVLARTKSPEEPPAVPAEPAPSAQPAATRAAPHFKPPTYEPEPGDRALPLSPRRRLIAEHMLHSKRTAPHVTAVAEVDLAAIVALRAHHPDPQIATSLSYLAFVAAATVRALREHPELNAVWTDEALILRHAIALGIAVEDEGGLVVPVIHDAEERSVVGLGRAIAELAERVHEGRMTRADVHGGSFTLSNPGARGNLFGTPILHEPQVGILRMGEVIKRPVVRTLPDGSDGLAIHPVMYLALSYDHRAVDGVKGNAFLHRVKTLLEEGKFEI